MNIDLEKVGAGIITALIGGVGWLIRRVVTNEKQIALLKQDLDRGREDIKEIKSDIKELLQNHDKR